MITIGQKIATQRTAVSRLATTDLDNIKFGRVFSDHMFVMDYADGAWQQPTIVPFANLQMSPAALVLHYSQTIFEERDVGTQISISNSDDGTIRFFINNAISSEGVKEALGKAMEMKAKLTTLNQDLNHVNEQLKVISEDQARLRANLRELPTTAAAYKRYLEKLDKQETEIESLREDQKKLQGNVLKQRQDVDRYLANLNVK